MGGIFSQQPMMVSKEAKRERTASDFTRDELNTRKTYEIVKSWEPGCKDFLDNADMPPIDSTLISEDLFMAQHPGHVRVWINIPTDAVKKPYVSLPSILDAVNVESLSETVSSLKDRIAQKIRVPANKQKLITLKSGVLEDNFSLAYYNIGDDEYMLFLSIEDSAARRSLWSPTVRIMS